MEFQDARNAFEISERLGLTDSIIHQAKSYTGTDRREVNSMIASLEESSRQAEKEAEEAEELLSRSKTSYRRSRRTDLDSFEEKKEQLREKGERKSK